MPLNAISLWGSFPTFCSIHRMIDVGCGTGDWLIECAHAFPQMRLLTGIDVSHSMIEAAKAQAMEAGVDNRIEFRIMATSSRTWYLMPSGMRDISLRLAVMG